MSGVAPRDALEMQLSTRVTRHIASMPTLGSHVKWRAFRDLFGVHAARYLLLLPAPPAEIGVSNASLPRSADSATPTASATSPPTSPTPPGRPLPLAPVAS